MTQESWKMDKDEMGCQPPEGPLLCANNCGFFGSATTMNLCSKCYRDVVLKQTKAAKAAASASAITNEHRVDLSGRHPQQEAIVVTAPSSSTQTVGGNGVSVDSSQQSPNRCLTCTKRVGLIGFKCRCGDTFCALHRYSDKHNCPFDYRTSARDAIAKANPVIKAEKLDKI